MTKDEALNLALEAIHEGWLFEDIDKKVAPALRQALAEWTPDDTAYRPDGLSQDSDQLPIDRGAWSDVPNATQWLDELRGDEPNLLNQTCCGCGKSNCFALYCGWCWGKGDEPVGYVDQSDLDREGHDFWVSRQEGTHTVPLYTAPPKREWVSLTDDDIKEIVGNWGDTPIRGYTRRLFDKIDAMYRKRNQDLNDTNNPF